MIKKGHHNLFILMDLIEVQRILPSSSYDNYRVLARILKCLVEAATSQVFARPDLAINLLYIVI